MSIRRLSVAMAIPMLALVCPGAASAGGPTPVTYDPTVNVTDPAADNAKASDLASFLVGSPLVLPQGATAQVAALSPCPLIVSTTCTPASPKYLTFSSYHQKTSSYCLPASIQSILHSQFGGYVSPSVKGGQDTIYASTGTSAGSGLTYLNAEFSYWPDHSGSATSVGHASVIFGYDPSATLYTIRIYDPWSYVTSDGSFYFGPAYNATPDTAGYYDDTTARYKNAFIGPLWY